MTAAKHTPGPWWVESQRRKGGDPFHVRSARGSIVDTDMSRERSAHHDGRDEMRALGEELRANARLIAAAPALLEALEMVRDADISDRARERVVAAIAAARGTP